MISSWTTTTYALRVELGWTPPPMESYAGHIAVWISIQRIKADGAGL